MAVVGWRRILEGTEISGQVGESLRITERWEIRTDRPGTAKTDILTAVPCGWNSKHWEFSDCTAQEFALSPNNRTGMVWTLTVTFYIPSPKKKVDTVGKPIDFWEGSGGVTIAPVYRDIDGQMIVNSAKDPLEGLQGEREEESWTLTRYYDDESWSTDRSNYAGAVNSDTWAGAGPHRWKCYFKAVRLKEIQDASLNATASGADSGSVGAGTVATRKFVETVWEFRKDLNTWKLMPWDVGFMELTSGQRKVILGGDGKPVKQPVALNSDGTKRTPGQAPSVIRNGDGAKIYREMAFGAKFGPPKIIPITQPA